MMTDPHGDLLLASALCLLLALGLSWLLVGRLIVYLHAKAILDRPNDRSSHSLPTPRGGGLVLALVVPLAALSSLLTTPPYGQLWPQLLVLLAALGLLSLSWRDDRGGLPIALRFACHFGAAALGLFAALPVEALIFQGLLPWGLDRLAALLLWVWFINLYNFMDGIDGICAVETISIGGGLLLLIGLGSLDPAFGPLAAALVGFALGFLRHNWAPARIFMGDVGSIPLGYLLGWLLLAAAADGQWLAALALPLYYLADASLTLAKRAARREKIWQAHRSHYYQRAARGFGSHAAVVRRLAGVNLGLILLVGSAARGHASMILALGLACLTVIAFLLRLNVAAKDAGE